MIEYQKSEWKSGTHTIKWEDADHVRIETPYGFAWLCGGDFEGVLEGLVDAFNCGKKWMEETNE